MVVKFDLIAAACENMGIGKNGNLPWRLKNEMAYFSRMTKETTDPNKKNVVLMGRKTWDSIPSNFKPMVGRINFVMSRSNLNLQDYNNTYSFTSLQDVISALESDKFREKFENVWVIGGSHIYEETMNSKYFHRLYLTKILKEYECDTFLPKVNDNLLKISDPRVPEDIQEENGVQYIYTIYQNPQFGQ